MSDYDYLNARLRAMAANLIPNGLLDQIAVAEGEDIFIDLLMDTAYARALSEARASGDRSGVAESALARNLYACIEQVRSIAGEGPLRLIDLQLNRWDLANVIAIVRGLRRGDPPEEIVRAMVPSGRIHPIQLAELAAETDGAAVADALGTWGSALATELRKALRSDTPAETERLLYAAYFERAFAQLDPRDPNDAILRRHLALQADLANLIVLLKGVDLRSKGATSPAASLIAGGTLPDRIVRELEAAADVERALELLDRTVFAEAVERGILSFGREKRLRDIERFLEAPVIEAGIRLFRLDPLSAGVPLGYLWKKISEYLNLRILLRGKRYRMPANMIREALILA